MPLVSVIIPAYNYAHYLPFTLDSVMQQSLYDWECLIIDDGSTDNTKQVSEKYTNTDSRFKYYYKNNGGLSSARNYGIKHASGKYILFLDADDLIETHNLLHLSLFLEQQEECAVFGKFIKFFDDSTADYLWYQDYNYTAGLQDDFHSRLVEKNSLPPCAPLSPLSIIKEHNLTFDESLTSYEDWDFWLRLSKYCNFYFHPTENAAARIRFHSGSMSTDIWRMETNQLKVRLKLKATLTNKSEISINNTGVESSVKTLLYYIADKIQNGEIKIANTLLTELIKIYPNRKIKILNNSLLLSHPTIFRRSAWLLWEKIINILYNNHIFRFLSKILLFLLPIILFDIITYKNEIIKLSNSESFNVKLCELHNLQNRHYDIIGIGSSMTLNNLNSETLVSELGNTSYHNLSSWGFRINNQLEFLPIITEVYSPSTIITVSNIVDFSKGDITFHNEIIKYYIKGLPTFLLRPFYYASFGYNLKCKKHIQAHGHYDCLDYDVYGGVNIDVKGSNIDSARWNDISKFRFDSTNNQYINLEAICMFLQFRNIKYIFVHSPARENYSSNNKEEINLHIKKVQQIVSKYDQIFLTPDSSFHYTDSCFIDGTHLNIEGSKILTKFICDKMKGIK